MQTAEGELEIQVPQIRGVAERFVSSVNPNGRTALRTRPLEALIIGGHTRESSPAPEDPAPGRPAGSGWPGQLGAARTLPLHLREAIVFSQGAIWLDPWCVRVGVNLPFPQPCALQELPQRTQGLLVRAHRRRIHRVGGTTAASSVPAARSS